MIFYWDFGRGSFVVVLNWIVFLEFFFFKYKFDIDKCVLEHNS